MIENREFEAAGVAVMHCEALRRSPLPERAQDSMLKALGGQLVGPIGDALGAMGIASPIEGQWRITGSQPFEDHVDRIGADAAHFLFGFGRSRDAIVASFPAIPLMHQLDLVLGGSGADARLPDTPHLPRSVELAARTLAGEVGRQLDGALGESFGAGPPRIERDLLKIEALAGADIQSIEFEFACPDGPPVMLFIAVRQADLQRMALQTAAVGDGVHAPDEILAPFTQIPLQLRAILAEIRISSRRLAGLQLDEILPIAVARNVPLCIGGSKVALGTVGEFDDCAALKITQNLL